jgi:spermidine synthase
MWSARQWGGHAFGHARPFLRTIERYMSAPLIYLLFFLSGISGLIYQVVWVREFGNVFGNTVYSTSIVLAIFMLGLGIGSYVVGRWADRRYAAAPGTLLKAYGYVEIVIAVLGLAISLALPALGAVSAALSGYTTGDAGWNVLSPLSYIARGVIAIALLAPITLLMGGTLTLLIRHLVRSDVAVSGRTIAVLYGINTVGAAAGAFLTDFLLVPAVGLTLTQVAAVVLNLVAGAGALWLASRTEVRLKPDTPAVNVRRRGKHVRRERSVRLQPDQASASAAPVGAVIDPAQSRAVVWTSLAIGLSGFAAMGMEILWLRHFNLMLGGFRAVFSLLLTVVLLGMGIGALAGGVIVRRTTRPAWALMIVQALFIAASLAGLGLADTATLRQAGSIIEPQFASLAPWQRAVAEFRFNALPMLREVLVPALLMGCAFPLANAVVQRAEQVVGTRAGLLYLANTAGAVLGTLVAGYVLLPTLGIQGSATALVLAAAIALVPLHLVARTPGHTEGGVGRLVPAAAAVVAVAAISLWLMLPGDFIVRRFEAPRAANERVVALSEGITEIIAVTEIEGQGRSLITNGHPMSSTARLDQRYMRALAHIPLLAMPAPERVLVIGFGVGNTTHAASLHPSVRQIDVADLSRHVLEHASYFRETHGGILDDPRVKVFVNDGRQHLQMQPEGSYDLITLEPPPIAYAGVGSLYSREFYALARSRLKQGAYLTQWLPIYQVPPETGLAMIRAFLDVFPETVLLSGAQAELLLVGTTGDSIQIDPSKLQQAILAAPDVAADLVRLDLGTVTEIAGTFVGSAETLALATRDITPVTDNRPLQEYGVRSTLGNSLRGLPESVVDLASISDWCPRCLGDDGAAVGGLDTYMALMYEAYTANVVEVEAAAVATPDRRILGSRYLGSVLPDSAAVYNIIGTGLLRSGRVDEARQQFAEAMRRDPASGDTQRNLGNAQYVEGTRLQEQGRYPEAIARFRAALEIIPDSAALHNDLGIALATTGNLAEATTHFQRAVELEPDFAEARQNLERALAGRR